MRKRDHEYEHGMFSHLYTMNSPQSVGSAKPEIPAMNQLDKYKSALKSTRQTHSHFSRDLARPDVVGVPVLIEIYSTEVNNLETVIELLTEKIEQLEKQELFESTGKATK